MSNVGLDRIHENAVAIRALQDRVGAEALQTTATTVAGGVNEAAQEAAAAAAATVLNSAAVAAEALRAKTEEASLRAAVGAEEARASGREDGLEARLHRVETVDLPALDARTTGRLDAIDALVGSAPLPTTAQTLSGAVQELRTAVSGKASVAKANANAAATATLGQTVQALDQTVQALDETVQANRAFAQAGVASEEARAKAVEAANALAVETETARALAAEADLRVLLQGNGGSTDALALRVTALEGALAALQALVANQSTLVVANRQDARAIDLTAFSEILVLPGGTLVLSPAQEAQLRGKAGANGEPWNVAFRSDGDVEVVASEPLDVRPERPYLFTRLVAEALVRVRGDQFAALAPTGTVAVDVSAPLDLRGLPVASTTTLNVLGGGEATVTPAQAQEAAVGTGTLRVVASEPTDFSLFPKAVAHRVVCEADCEFTALPEALEKAAGATVTLRVLAALALGDVPAAVDALDLRTTVQASPAEAHRFSISKGPHGALHAVLAGGGEVDLRPFPVAAYDALLLQATDAVVDGAQAEALPVVHRDRGKVVLAVDGAAPLLPSDAAFVATVDVVRSTAPLALTLAQALNATVEGGAEVTLRLSADADLSTLSLGHVHRVESTRAVRLSHAQWKAFAAVSAASVALTVRSPEDLRGTDLGGVDTLELFAACQATVAQAQGRTVVNGQAHLVGHAEGMVDPAFSLADVGLLVGADAVVRAPQLRQAGAIAGTVTLTVPPGTVESLVGDDLAGLAALRVEGAATVSVAQYKAVPATKGSGGNLVAVLGEGNGALDRVDHLDAVRVGAGAALTMRLEDVARVTVHKEGGLLYALVREATAAAGHPSVDGFDVLLGAELTVAQADAGRVRANAGVVVLEGATRAPTVPGIVRIVVEPVAPVGLTTASPAIGDLLRLAGDVVDPHLLGTVVPEVRWMVGGQEAAAGESFAVPQGAVGQAVAAVVSWTVPWLRAGAGGEYDPSAAPLARQFTTEAAVVNTAGVGTVEGLADAEVFVGDKVRLAISDPDGVAAVLSRAWFRDGAPTGESGEEYALTTLDFGAVLSCEFAYTDGRGAAEAGVAVRARLPPLEASTAVSELAVGALLPPVALSRGAQALSVQWFVVAPGSGAQAAYTRQAVYGATGTEFYARATTPEGAVVETPRLPVAAYAPAGGLHVVGIAQTGETVVAASTVRDLNLAHEGNEAGDVPASALAFEWYRCDSLERDNLVVVGAGPSLSLTDDFQGQFIGVRGAYTDGAVTRTVVSVPVPYDAKGSLSIATPVPVALLVPGDTIAASVADADGVVAVHSVAWRRGGGTVSSTAERALAASDFGEPLVAEASYTDEMGHTATVTATVLLPATIPLVRLADLNGRLLTGLRAGAESFVRVSPAFVGLPYRVLVDGGAVASGFAMDYLRLGARAEGETVVVEVDRGNGEMALSVPVPVRTVVLVRAGGSLRATIHGPGDAVVFVEFYLDGSIQSRGSLGTHVLSPQDAGATAFAVVQDAQGRRFRSETIDV